jgi:SAM-dependent methyltransferase
MSEIWEKTFADKQMIWGLESARSALFARDLFVRSGAKDVLIPGIGYGRNASPFLAAGMTVTGIEISATAIDLARSQLGLTGPIFHGSVTDMPFDERRYHGIFCYGLLYLLDAAARAKLVGDCRRQLAPGGHMVFTVISKRAPMYGRGTRLGDDWYETHPGVQLYFYDAESIERELGPHGLVEVSEIDEPAHGGSTLPFLNAVCRNG